MKNLITHPLEKLDLLRHKDAMKERYNSVFHRASRWRSRRSHHGDYIYHKASRILGGSVGKYKKDIVARIAEFWPSNWHESAVEFVENYADYMTKVVDGTLLLNPGYLYRQEKAWLTLEEIEARDKGYTYKWRVRYGGEFYYDQDNILRKTPTLRKAKPKQTRKEYMEKKKAKSKWERNISALMREIARTIVLQGKTPHYHLAALRSLIDDIQSAKRLIVIYTDNPKPLYDGTSDMNWYQMRRGYLKDEIAKEKKLTAELYKVADGDLSYLEEFIYKKWNIS